MVADSQNNYIVKQSSGIIWNFFYSSKNGILYRTYNNNVWSLNKSAAKDGTENFSVILTNEDKVILLYQDIYGNIIMSNYIKDSWFPEIFMKRKKETYFSIFFDAVILNDDIHIVYCIPDENSGKYALIHQTSIIGEKLHQPIAIDILNSAYNIPFYLYTNSSNTLLFYQNFKNTWELGYRKYLKEHTAWSNFTVIDRSRYPFKDISFVSHDNLNYLSYIKKDDKEYLSFYSFNEHSIRLPMYLCKDDKIKSCCIFTSDEQIWINFTINNECSSIFSCDNGENWAQFSSSKSFKTLPVKAKFLYNKKQDTKLSINEFLIEDISNLKIFTISQVYTDIFEVNPLLSNENKSYKMVPSEHQDIQVSEYYSKFLAYQKQQAEYEEKINKMSSMISQYASSLEKAKKSSNELSYKYYKLLDENKKISSSLSAVQEELIKSHERINDLEKKLIGNEETILSLQKENTELKDEKDIWTAKCDDYMKEIKNLQDENAEINTLKSQIEKSKEPFIKRFFGQ